MSIANAAFLEHLQHNDSFSFNLDDTLQTINSHCHVHFIVGRQDTCVGFEDQFELSKRLLNSSCYLIDYAGHNLQIDQESTFNSIVMNILK